jgi:hypothetical protein
MLLGFQAVAASSAWDHDFALEGSPIHELVLVDVHALLRSGLVRVMAMAGQAPFLSHFHKPFVAQLMRPRFTSLVTTCSHAKFPSIFTLKLNPILNHIKQARK